MRVLLVEDDTSTAKSIELMLKSEGYIVDLADLGEDGLEIGKIYDYDIIILDLMLPDMDGYDVLKALRDAKVETPILILSGLTELDNKIKGLGYGADDYLTKPFDKRELIARIQAIVRRSQGHSQSVIATGKVSVNLDTRTVEVDSKPLAPHGQGIRDHRTAFLAQRLDPDQGNVPEPPLWRHGRTGSQNHRRLHLQTAQKIGGCSGRR
jgi:two-component system cell cycle response regulator CtrA